MTRYQYFLVSLVPDPVRNEQVNIGVLGLYKDKVLPLFLKNYQKIQAIAPDYDTSVLPGEGVIDLILKTPTKQRSELVTTLADDFLHISSPAIGMAKDYESFEIAMKQIYDRLVKPVIKQVVRPKVTTLKTSIRSVFKKKGLLGDKIADRKIVPDYLIAASENLTADFAYKNGTLNLVETIDYRVSLKRIAGDKFKETALAAIKIDEARRKIDQKAKGRLLFIPPDQDNIKIAPHQSLLSDYYDNIYNYANRDELSRFYADVEQDISDILL